MKTFSMTHIGRRREMNQDYMYTSENAVGKLPNLFLVADGMGGHKAGEYASRFTVEKIVETIETSGQTEPVAKNEGSCGGGKQRSFWKRRAGMPPRQEWELQW